MKFVFLMDPLETVVMEKDTSFILMLGAHNKGHEIYFLPEGGITLKNGRVIFHTTKVMPQAISHQPFVIDRPVILTDDQVDVVFIRTDPPFDAEYLMATWLLDRLPARVKVFNRPSGIRRVNEKIWATQFTSIIPPTLVSCNKHDLMAFTQEEENTIAKPTDGFGGQSVFHIHPGQSNTNVILETLTQRWTKEIIIQRYVPDSKDGDKRILLLNGEPLGAVLRMHCESDHRNNFFAGGKPKATEITARDHEIINVLKPKLQELGLYFVGIDVIGPYLIEVNVTSPTGLQEMNRLYNVTLENTVIEFVEKLTKT
ncbi:MAG: glutathione synthase [Candidatus Omnitrophica bacterium]|nr:glutathione synthase [Candidatus Omnitrophota bacterium]